MWEVKSLDNKNDEFTFNAASDYATSINNDQGLCSFTDWRVPTIKELHSITDRKEYKPAIDTNYFPNTNFSELYSPPYWSISPSANTPDSVWSIHFYRGSSGGTSKDHTLHTRLVRGGQYFDFFDYTKLDSNGNDLPDNSASWSCIRDNHSGLIWEVKTDENKNIEYPYSTGLNNNIFSYVSEINQAGLCGYNDWRAPEIDNLLTLADYDSYEPAIKTNYFPYTISLLYWSASPYADGSGNAWYVNFNYGSTNVAHMTSSQHLRLVRTGQPSVSLSLPAILFLLF